MLFLTSYFTIKLPVFSFFFLVTFLICSYFVHFLSGWRVFFSAVLFRSLSPPGENPAMGIFLCYNLWKEQKQEYPFFRVPEQENEMAAKYIRLADRLREQILQTTGQVYKLPSENELCKQYQVSRQTVRTALQLLAQEGLIEKRCGSGSYSTGLGYMKNRIAVIAGNAEEYTMPALLADIKSVLREKGYQTNVYSTHFRISEERRILEELSDTAVRGLIVQGTKTTLPNPNLDLYERLRKKGVALLFLGGYYKAFSSSVYIKDDNYYGGYLLGKYLIGRGHTRIGAVFQMDEIAGPERYQGFSAALRDFSISLLDDLVLWYTCLELEALETRSDTGFLTAFLRKNASLCSAIICQNDEIAYWLIRELHYAKVRVPEDISVVSFDNSYMSELGSIRITTLSHKEHEPGQSAARALLRMIQGETVLPEELSWRLAAGGSDAPCGAVPFP